jgi:hypothetical protein
MRAYVFRFAPNNGHRQTDRPNWSIRAKPEVGGLLFDHLVGAGAFVPGCVRHVAAPSLTSVNKNMVEAIDGKRR